MPLDSNRSPMGSLMTPRLSINVNRVALLRNSRTNLLPSLLEAVDCCVRGGAQGITVHPRPDERHIRGEDVGAIAAHLRNHYPQVEYNIEGYPDDRLLELVRDARPTQCTLVPDSPDQATSDHGWDVAPSADLLRPYIQQLHDCGTRVSLFMDPSPESEVMAAAADVGADRIELYTEQYADDWGTGAQEACWQQFVDAAASAARAGLGINAGHDLNLKNLPLFATLPGLLECSIGHAVACDALFVGMTESVRRYRQAIAGNPVDCDWYPPDYRLRKL